MARNVVCKLCKTKGNSDTFYKITDEKGKNKYYCSKEEYDNFQIRKEKRYNLLKYIAEEVLELEEGQIVNPSMVKKIEKLAEFYDYEVIHACFKLNRETIQYWMGAKNFSSEFGMTSYIMKIIEGNINDVYAQWKHIKRVEQKQEKEIVDFNVINEINDVVPKKQQENNGISDFLDEEDM